jgi:hypothetical protein
MAISKDDFMAMVQAWVLGKLYEICMPGGHYYSQMTDGNNSFDHRKFHEFALRTHSTVHAYMMRRKTLDGTCSDMECTMAMEAHRFFRPQLNQILYGDIIRLRDDGQLDEAIRLYRKMELVGLKEAHDFVTELKV